MMVVVVMYIWECQREIVASRKLFRNLDILFLIKGVLVATS
jgi:hypothetical protein